MDTITTIQNLLTCNGCAAPVMVALTPNEISLIAAAPSMHAELTARRARDADVEALVAAAKDMRSGWEYIRDTHGDLYGVGWDRAQDAIDAALALQQESRNAD